MPNLVPSSITPKMALGSAPLWKPWGTPNHRHQFKRIMRVPPESTVTQSSSAGQRPCIWASIGSGIGPDKATSGSTSNLAQKTLPTTAHHQKSRHLYLQPTLDPQLPIGKGVLILEPTWAPVTGKKPKGYRSPAFHHRHIGIQSVINRRQPKSQQPTETPNQSS
jgi:hypothetical protein